MPAQATTQGKTEKVSTLENLAELLVAFYNGASSSDVSSMARFATSSTISTDILFLNNVVRTLCYAVTGLLLFGGAIIHYLCTDDAGENDENGEKKGFKSVFSGRVRDILFSCFSMLIGGILLATQVNRASTEKNTVVIGFGYLFVIFSGYLTGGGSLKNAAKSLRQQAESQDQAGDAVTASEQSIAMLPVNKKDNLENYLRLILSFRNAVIAAGGTGLGYSATANNVSVDKLLLNYALIHLFYGAACAIFTHTSLFHDACCTDRSDRIGCVNMFNGHFSGVKLQITLSGKSSFFGALILLIQSMTTKNPLALAIAEWFLGMSGFLTGSKVTGIFKQMVLPLSVPDSPRLGGAVYDDRVTVATQFPLPAVVASEDVRSNQAVRSHDPYEPMTPDEQEPAVVPATPAAPSVDVLARTSSVQALGLRRLRAGSVAPSVQGQWDRADDTLGQMRLR